MEPVQFSDALSLTGLTDTQLREWCGKRNLFAPTVPARGPGRLALFTWQDIVALRVFHEVVSVFGGKAVGWSDGVAHFRKLLDGQFFLSLWDKSVIFTDQRTAMLYAASSVPLDNAALVVPLAPHLNAIENHRAPQEPQRQLPLVTQIGGGR